MCHLVHAKEVHVSREMATFVLNSGFPNSRKKRRQRRSPAAKAGPAHTKLRLEIFLLCFDVRSILVMPFENNCLNWQPSGAPSQQQFSMGRATDLGETFPSVPRGEFVPTFQRLCFLTTSFCFSSEPTQADDCRAPQETVWHER